MAVKQGNYGHKFETTQKMNSKGEIAVVICKQCGTKFTCGANAGDGACWCFELPNVMPLSNEARSSDDCYCKKCLEEMINRKK